MKISYFYRKSVSLIVLVTFIELLHFSSTPAKAAPIKGDTETTISQGDSEGPKFVEEEGNTKTVAKKTKKFPWLIMGVAVVISVAVLYFLVIKKPKYTLTVYLTGATGTPAETANYKKGSVVNYNYSASNGNVHVEVKLDGAAVAAAGIVTMDADHTLTVMGLQAAIIKVNSSPSGAKIYLDNVDSGFTTPHSFQYNIGVTKSVLVRKCGYGDYTMSVTANNGQVVTVDPNLDKGIHEDFDAPASSCWMPYTSSSWSTSGGLYKYTGNVKAWDYSYYNYAFSDNYTVTVKMRRVQGSSHIDTANAVLLASTNNITSCAGYCFQYSVNGWFSIWMPKTYNLITGSGHLAVILDWSPHEGIDMGYNSWNTLKIVKAGKNYSFYINDNFLHSFSNATYNPHYIVLTNDIGNENSIIEYDYVYHSFGATSDSIPGLPATPFTSMFDNSKRR